jgi:hypothetical protein
MSDKPKRMKQVCQQNSQFNRLFARAGQLDKLNIILQKSLPLQFVNHCQLANISGDSLVIITDKAAYASMLRFQGPQICQALSAHLPEPVGRLEVKVRPLPAVKRPPASNNMQLSTKTAALLNSTAAEIEDGPLKTALHKLARRQAD